MLKPLAEINCFVGSLRSMLEAEDPLKNGLKTAYIDFRFGVFSGLHSARDLGSQLDILIHDNQLGGGGFNPVTADDMIGFWVDAEGRGDSLIRSSSRLANKLGNALKSQSYTAVLVLLGNQPSGFLPEEEINFLWLLRSILYSLGVDLILQQESDRDVSLTITWLKDVKYISIAGYPLSSNKDRNDSSLENPLIGGIISGCFVEEISAFQSLQGLELLETNKPGTYLTFPSSEWRLGVINELFDRESLVRFLNRHPLFYAAAVEKGLEPTPEDFPLLCKAAWRVSAQGGIVLAVRILCNLLDHSRKLIPDLYPFILLEIQKLRISAQKYFDAANQSALYELLTPEERKQYLITVAWGRVLSGNSAGALEAFVDAGPPGIDCAESKIDLYLLNIYALVMFRNDRYKEALNIEKSILCYIEEKHKFDYHLMYINAFNLARLYRSVGDVVNEFRYTSKAFSATDGLRTDADKLYFNLTLASLLGRANRPRESFLVTLRAAIHWLSCEVQASIGWRTLLAIFGYRVQMSPEIIPMISDNLTSLLLRRAKKAGIDAVYSKDACRGFVSINEHNWDSLYGRLKNIDCEYFSSLFILEEAAESSEVNQHDKILISLVCGLLFGNGIEPIKTQTDSLIYVDDGFGSDIAIKDCNFLTSDSARNRWKKYSIDEYECLLDVKVFPNNAVAEYFLDCEGVEYVRYKRYLGRYAIPENYKRSLKALYEAKELTIRELVLGLKDHPALPENIMKVVLGLESKRILSLDKYNNSCSLLIHP